MPFGRDVKTEACIYGVLYDRVEIVKMLENFLPFTPEEEVAGSTPAASTKDRRGDGLPAISPFPRLSLENYLVFSIGSPINAHESLTSMPPGICVFASLIRSPIRLMFPSPSWL